MAETKETAVQKAEREAIEQKKAIVNDVVDIVLDGQLSPLDRTPLIIQIAVGAMANNIGVPVKEVVDYSEQLADELIKRLKK